MARPKVDIGLDPARPFVEGDTKTLRIAFTREGQPFDLTGATVRWGAFPWPGHQRSMEPESSPFVSKSTAPGGGITIPDPESGIAYVALTSADTVGRAGMNYHEAEAVDASGNKATVPQGRFLITRQRIV